MSCDVDCNDKRESKDSSSHSTSFQLKAVAGYCGRMFVKLMTTFSRADSLIDPEKRRDEIPNDS